MSCVENSSYHMHSTNSSAIWTDAWSKSMVFLNWTSGQRKSRIEGFYAITKAAIRCFSLPTNWECVIWRRIRSPYRGSHFDKKFCLKVEIRAHVLSHHLNTPTWKPLLKKWSCNSCNNMFVVINRHRCFSLLINLPLEKVNTDYRVQNFVTD